MLQQLKVAGLVLPNYRLAKHRVFRVGDLHRKSFMQSPGFAETLKARKCLQGASWSALASALANFHSNASLSIHEIRVLCRVYIGRSQYRSKNIKNHLWQLHCAWFKFARSYPVSSSTQERGVSEMMHTVERWRSSILKTSSAAAELHNWWQSKVPRMPHQKLSRPLIWGPNCSVQGPSQRELGGCQSREHEHETASWIRAKLQPPSRSIMCEMLSGIESRNWNEVGGALSMFLPLVI